MTILGIRFCCVSPDAPDQAAALEKLGLAPRKMEMPAGMPPLPEGTFPGAVFPASDGSWIELWKDGPGMPAGTMLQIVVDDADAYAATAKSNGLEPHGPTDAHGERIYFLMLPGGLAATFQSKLPDAS